MENLFTRDNFDVELFQSITGVKITDVPEDQKGVLLKDIYTNLMNQLVSEYRDMKMYYTYIKNMVSLTPSVIEIMKLN